MPAGRPPQVEHIRNGFLKSIESARSLVHAALQIETVRQSKKCPGLHSKHVRRIIELAFMGTVAAWEEFQEQTLVRFVCGAKAGSMPKLRLGKCKNIQHAFQLISGNPDYNSKKDYMNWSSPEKVRKRAGLFLEGGGTYSTPLAKYEDALDYALRLRNRVAHSSEKAGKQFTDTARRLRNSKKLRQGYRVGDLLLEKPINIAHLPQGSNNYFESFMLMYEDLAKTIVP